MTETPGVQEIGTAGGIRQVRNGRAGEQYRSEPLERNPDLRFPESIPVYDRMRSDDGHIGSVLNAIVLTTAKANWQLVGDARPEVMEMVRRNLGLPEPGQPRDTTGGVSLHSHIVEAAEPTLWAGFMCFEKVYRVDPDTGEVSLRKLAPRMPRTVEEFIIERDGGLVAVRQTPPDDLRIDPVEIPVDRLVVYVNRKEGADWSGRSILRTAYKHWMLKDKLIRLDAQAAERNSMGIPSIRYSGAENRALAEELVSQVRAGERAGLALPDTMEFSLQGVTGSTVDLVDRLRYHDQEMARASLAMFLDVTSNENGSRALMEPVLGVFLDSVQAFADGLAEVATEHIIRDLVKYNYGSEEPYPVLTPGDLKAAQGISVEALKTLVDMQVVLPDEELERTQRERYGLPSADKDHRRYTRPAGETVGALVQAGYLPDAASEAVGLPALEHSGESVEEPDGDGPSGTPALPGLGELTAQLASTAKAREAWYKDRHHDATSS